MRHRRFIFFCLATALIVGSAAWRIARPSAGKVEEPAGPQLVTLSGPTMGSTWSVKLRQLPAGLTSEQAVAAVQGVVDRVDGQMSTYKPESDLSRFNRYRNTDPVTVPDDVARVVAEARRVSEQTGGAFDVTVGPLVNLWGFGPGQPAGPFGTVPSDEALAAARSHVGYRMLHVDESPPALRKDDPDAYVDLSAIAKGYAADLVAWRLDSLGVADYLVEVGGELRAKGVSHMGRPWHVGVETPEAGAREVFLRVELKDLSIATSGDYRNFFDKDGRRYSHEIDPRTGRPVAGDLASVSVVHASCAYADAMATALMVLGTGEGYELARQLNLAVLLILRREGGFETKTTTKFERLIASGASTAPTTPGQSAAR